jgi:formate dehydrogenase iron-sulfur subunit
MSLPLLVRAPEDDGTFVYVTPRAGLDAAPGIPDSNRQCGLDVTGRMPNRAPAAGEQFRFHVDMDSCIGCKCCVVACNEQNGNPAEINWRRVGEIEGGQFPATRRAYFSMGCNHCVEPTCLAGCPVDAYSKDAFTGIVRHSAETCIGCQYCTWTCSYGVPQFNAERRVVGKCDMCYGRLSAGQAPACVSACPEGAIAIEIVNVAEWRETTAAASAGSGVPRDDGSLSTTRVTVPARLPEDAQPIDLARVAPAEPHGPLVVMLVLTQMAVGGFAAIWLAAVMGAADALAMPALVALSITGLALAASTTHLGRPIHAYRAMRMWRRSWLSREVVLFGGFAKLAAAATALFWLEGPFTALAAGAATAVGIAGVGASARIYHVVSRPAWNSWRTEVEFASTAVLLGGLFAAATDLAPAVGRAVAVVAAVALIGVVVADNRRRARSSLIELRGAAKLLAADLRPFAVTRLTLLGLGGLVLPMLGGAQPIAIAALVLALAGELVGRYLFFTTAVPRHMTAAYTVRGSEAA